MLNSRFIFFLISSLYLVSCSNQVKINHASKKETKAKIENDTLFFSYQHFNKKKLFESFETPIDLNKINDSLDKSLFEKIIKDKNHFKARKKMSFYNEDYKDNSQMLISNAGKIKLGNTIYYYFFYANFYYNCFECVNFLSLYEYNLTSKKLVRIPIGYQTSDTPLCLGDFNNDNKLDYLHWYYNDKATLYSISEGSLILNKDYFLSIKRIDLNIYTVSKTESKWFYKL